MRVGPARDSASRANAQEPERAPGANGCADARSRRCASTSRWPTRGPRRDDSGRHPAAEHSVNVDRRSGRGCATGLHQPPLQAWRSECRVRVKTRAGSADCCDSGPPSRAGGVGRAWDESGEAHQREHGPSRPAARLANRCTPLTAYSRSAVVNARPPWLRSAGPGGPIPAAPRLVQVELASDAGRPSSPHSGPGAPQPALNSSVNARRTRRPFASVVPIVDIVSPFGIVHDTGSSPKRYVIRVGRRGAGRCGADARGQPRRTRAAGVRCVSSGQT